jgi:peptidoglycan/xylan/chitin deacetylase (PgdA/CDA1 family)
MKMPDIVDTLQRWGVAHWWLASGQAAKDRQELYGGATGLRIVTFHETLEEELAQVRELVDLCRRRFLLATPADADELLAGRWRPDAVDKVLITFDDGLSSNFEAARWLHQVGVKAIFFIVPSIIDRSMEEYLRYHEQRGVKAYPPESAPGGRGLSAAQVREMKAMGHRIGAQNFAHRDLGRLHTPEEMRYEIGQAVDGVRELIGEDCQDFAIGFGQPENLSNEAVSYLLENCARVYACHRGLNVPGITPRFLLRHAIDRQHPFAFTRACVEGGADRRLAGRAREMVRRVGVLPSAPPAPAATPTSRSLGSSLPP